MAWERARDPWTEPHSAMRYGPLGLAQSTLISGACAAATTGSYGVTVTRSESLARKPVAVVRTR
jgi:hypothetical protein